MTTQSEREVRARGAAGAIHVGSAEGRGVTHGLADARALTSEAVERAASVVEARKGWAHPHLPNQGKTNEWYTPEHVFTALGIRFDLDPCAPPGGVPWIPAVRHFSQADDGLNREWSGRVWLNPPYGKEAGAWVEKLADHGWGIALVFSRTDVRWWHRAVPRATAVCFIEGRLTFIAGAGQSAPGNSGGPSALIAYGEDCARALERSGLGIVYREAVRDAA